MIAHENRGKCPSSAPAIVEQRLLERHTARDLLEDLGLIRGELGGAPLIGDVVADRLVLDHLAGRVDEGPIGPLIPAERAVERHLRSTCVRTESPSENDCRRSSTRGLSDAGRRSTSLTPASASLLQPKNSANARLTNVSVASGR